MPYYQDNHIRLYNKSCRDMTELKDESVQMVVTSPPYWGLRKYSGEQEIPEWGCAYGLEPTPELYVQHTIEILREIRRVLRKDGVVWWNIGDSYAANRSYQVTDTKWRDVGNTKGSQVPQGLKPKDLCLIPFRVAIAAQEDGWWVRSVIIWSKPNPMPESVTDRPTESHEYILMLTKSAKYYWDADAVRETWKPNQSDIARALDGNYRYQGKHKQGYDQATSRADHLNAHATGQPIGDPTKGRNIRSVWEFPTQPYPEAHFAVFPEKLPETCIKAATPEVGCCSKCGAPWERLVEKVKTPSESWHNSRFDDGKNLVNHPDVGRREDAKTSTAYDKKTTAGRLALLRQQSRENGGEYINKTKTLGWQPTCKCGAEKVPSLVLDPFSGAGTTLWKAKKLNRKAVGYEISDEYCQLTVDRIRQQVLL